MDTNVYETVMAMRAKYVEHITSNTRAHLERYITNRNARTGQTWHVVERYCTDGYGHRVTIGAYYDRALIANECGERVRIWYYGPYWRVA